VPADKRSKNFCGLNATECGHRNIGGYRQLPRMGLFICNLPGISVESVFGCKIALR
jgi:hypothetical protein